jgi:uncharacterized protein with LGFP repeats
MPDLNDAQRAAYRLANANVAFNPDAAIAKKWLELKSDGMLIGVPIGDELDVGNGHRAQAFTSGAVLVWRGGDNVELV